MLELHNNHCMNGSYSELHFSIIKLQLQLQQMNHKSIQGKKKNIVMSFNSEHNSLHIHTNSRWWGPLTDLYCTKISLPL